MNSDALKYYKNELLELKKQLEFIIGKEIKDEEIFESLKKYNNFKKTLSEVQHLNISSSQKLEIFQKAILLIQVFGLILNLQ